MVENVARLHLEQDTSVSTPYMAYFPITLQDAWDILNRGARVSPLNPSPDAQVPNYLRPEAIIAALKQQGLVLGTEYPIHRAQTVGGEFDETPPRDATICPLELVLFSFDPEVQERISSNIGVDPIFSKNEHPYQQKEEQLYRFFHQSGTLTVWNSDDHTRPSPLMVTEVYLVHPSQNGKETEFRRTDYYSLAHLMERARESKASGPAASGGQEDDPSQKSDIGLLVNSSIVFPELLQVGPPCVGYSQGRGEYPLLDHDFLNKTLNGLKVKLGQGHEGPFLSRYSLLIYKAGLRLGLTEEERRMAMANLGNNLIQILGRPEVVAVANTHYWIKECKELVRSSTGHVLKPYTRGFLNSEVDTRKVDTGGISLAERKEIVDGIKEKTRMFKERLGQFEEYAAEAIRKNPDWVRALQAI